MRMVLGNFLCARLTTSDAWTCYALNVVGRSAGRISQLLTGNITLNISLARYVLRSSVHKTATMSMRERFIVIITIPHNLAQRCNGCQTAILKQFVEIFRNGQNQHWHPECYMIHKFWNVRLAPTGKMPERPDINAAVVEEERELVKEEEEKMEDKVYRIWSTLSTFEESSASCISDMLLHVSNGVYVDGVIVARKFIWHVDILFGATDTLAALVIDAGLKELAYGREAKLLCKKVVAFFTLLSKTQETGVRKLGVTQELLSLVTGLAHYLKLLIRIGLQGALKLEREKHTVEGLHAFLDELADLETIKEQEFEKSRPQ